MGVQGSQDSLFENWCQLNPSTVAGHRFEALQEIAGKRAGAVTTLEKALPLHYEAQERLSRHLQRLGWPKTAALLKAKLPTDKKLRSGELGEVLGAIYIDEQMSPFKVPIKRLRWKDGRNVAMRGDDIIGLHIDAKTGNVRFLKGECKSRVNLARNVITQAREALNRDNGLPTPHTLSFISQRLFELDEIPQADAVDDQMISGIRQTQVTHYLFVLSANEPKRILEDDLRACSSQFQQCTVALTIKDHASFIKLIYEGATRA